MEDAFVAEMAVNIDTVITFVGYLVLILLIGILSSRFSSKDITNYFVEAT